MRGRRSRVVPSREGEGSVPEVCLRTVLGSWPDSRSGPTPVKKEAVSSEISESSDEMGPLLMSIAAVHTLEVASIRALTVLFIVVLD
jgi:hypothetical protein